MTGEAQNKQGMYKICKRDTFGIVCRVTTDD